MRMPTVKVYAMYLRARPSPFSATVVGVGAVRRTPVQKCRI
jgi:hypothetical protein